jgi:hypothetical protein
MIMQTIVDQIINDSNIIKTLLETLYKSKSDISISYRKNDSILPINHDRVRLLSVKEDTFDISVINDYQTMIVRNIPITGVEYICSTVSPSEVFIKKNEVQKGDTLDIS